MPIDLSQVDWLYVALLAIFVFVTTFVGGVLSFGRRWTAASAVSFAVRGTVRVLDLLPAPRAGAAGDQFAGYHHHYGSGAVCARCSGSAAKAAQSGHRYYPAQPGHRRHAPGGTGCSARGSCNSTRRAGAFARSPGALGLQATVRMMFSQDVKSIAGEEGKRAA